MERNGEEWAGIETNGEEWRGIKRNGEEWGGIERNGSILNQGGTTLEFYSKEF